MDAPRCHECDARTRLTPSGVCVWRAGCEHRQLVAEARIAELDRFLDPPVEAVESWIEQAIAVYQNDPLRLYLAALREEALGRVDWSVDDLDDDL